MTDRNAPCCKPFRIVELVSLIVVFILLFFLKKHDFHYDIVVGPNLLLFLFTSFTTFLLLTGLDVFCQMIRHPISNVPMIEVITLGAAFSFVAGIFTLVVRISRHATNAYVTLSVLSMITCLSFFITIIFILDTIILIKFV